MRVPVKRAILEVESLTLDLSGQRILEDINLSVSSGEFLGIVGPNGGGKTSLLRLLLGVISPSRGRVRWAQGPRGERPRIGYVPQRAYVDSSYPLCAREIVKQGLTGRWPLFGSARRDAAFRAEELLNDLGLGAQAETSFVHLSGGQQRRCLLARALMDSPSALLLDEPTAGVDTDGQRQFCAILERISAEGITIVLVSHDIPLITRYAQGIACIAGTLHWHGAAAALEQRTVAGTYRCELERYQVRKGAVSSDRVTVLESSLYE